MPLPIFVPHDSRMPASSAITFGDGPEPLMGSEVHLFQNAPWLMRTHFNALPCDETSDDLDEVARDPPASALSRHLAFESTLARRSCARPQRAASVSGGLLGQRQESGQSLVHGLRCWKCLGDGGFEQCHRCALCYLSVEFSTFELREVRPLVLCAHFVFSLLHTASFRRASHDVR